MDTLTISTTNNDQYGANSGSYYPTTSTIRLCHDNGGVGDNHLTTAWIPFNINLPQGKQIVTAQLYFYASQTRNDVIDCEVGCEDVNQASIPTSAADIIGRTMTSHAIDHWSPSAYTVGVQYNVGVLAAVQEVLDRPGWSYGNRLAVLIKGNSTGVNDKRRVIASYENSSYPGPRLIITYGGFIPQVLGVI